MVMNEWNAAFGCGGVSSEVNDRSPIEPAAVTQYRPLTADRSEPRRAIVDELLSS